MIYTIGYVRDKYTKYNEELFGGKLPPFEMLEFVLTMKQNPWGRGGVVGVYYIDEHGRPTRGKASGIQYRKPYLELSNYYDNTEEWKDNVLVHEMVHIYEWTCEQTYIIESHNLNKHTKNYPANGHGLIFNREASRLAKYGWEITRFVSQEEQNSATASEETLKKLNKKLGGMFFMFGEYNTPCQGYKYGYRLIKSEKIFNDFICHNQRTLVNSMKDVKFYYNLDGNFVAKFMSNRPNIGQWYLTNSKYDDKLIDTPFKTIDEALHGFNKAKETDEALKVTLKNEVIGELDSIAEALLDKMRIKVTGDEYYERYVLAPFTLKYKLPSDIIKIEFNKSNIIGVKNGVINICDFDDTQGYGIAYDVDCMDYDPNGDGYEEHRVEALHAIKLLIRKCFSITKEDLTAKLDLIKLFRMSLLNGNAFELKNTTKEEIFNKLKERFPKWSDEIIQKQVDNPKWYPQNENNFYINSNIMENKEIEFLIEDVIKEFIGDNIIGLGNDDDTTLDSNFPQSICDN